MKNVQFSCVLFAFGSHKLMDMIFRKATHTKRLTTTQVGKIFFFNKIHDIVDRIVVILSCVVVGFHGAKSVKIFWV